MPLKPGQSICNGKYKILELIGEGGFARVWKAEEPGFGHRLVAVKELKREQFSAQELEEFEHRFQREVEVSAALLEANVPNVMRTITLERLEETGERLLVLEYVPGDNLADLIAQHPQGLPIEQAVQITMQVCDALAGFHALSTGPVHRDVKPSNILLTAEGQARLGDFGTAQLPGDTVVGSRTLGTAGWHPGTPLYMSPEQELTRGYLRVPSDIFALGCVLFEMLTGGPYKRQRPGTLPSQLRPEVPLWLDEAVAKALHEDQLKRWESASEFKAVLETGLRQEKLARRTQAELGLKAERKADEQERRRQARLDVPYRGAVQSLKQEKYDQAQAKRVKKSRRPPLRRALVWVGGLLVLTILAAAGVVAVPMLLPQLEAILAPAEPTRPLSAATPPLGQIAFAAYQDDHLALHMAQADGTGTVVLNMPGWSPSWSPGGSQIVFVSDRGGAQQLYVIAGQGGSSIRLTDSLEEKVAPAWSPDGQWIAFIARTSAGDILDLVNRQGINRRAMTDINVGDVARFAWSPDGRWLLFEAQQSGEHRVYRVQADGTGLQALTDFDSWWPAWSSDGEHIAVSSKGGVYTLDKDGTNRLQLTTFRGWAPSWSPDGRRMAFLSNRGVEGQNPELWLMDADGRNQARLTTSGCWGYAWAPDGEWLAYLTGNMQAQTPVLRVWAVNVTTREQQEIAQANEPHLSWKP